MNFICRSLTLFTSFNRKKGNADDYKVSNLVFADDCLIFTKATTKGAMTVIDVLNKFVVASGQQINFNKSSLYFSANTNSQVKKEIVNILQIQHKSTIDKYLGIHNIVF